MTNDDKISTDTQIKETAVNDPNLCVKKSDIELIKEFYGEKLGKGGDMFAYFVTGIMDMIRRDKRVRDDMYEVLKFWEYMFDHV